MKIPLSDYRAMNKINQIAENIQATREVMPSARNNRESAVTGGRIRSENTPIFEIEYRDGTCETLIPAPTTSKTPKPRQKRK